MFRFTEKVLVIAIKLINFNLSNVQSLEFVSKNNQESKIGSEIINVNTNGPMFYLYSIKVNKCKGSCNKSTTHMLKYLFLIPLKT